MEQAGRKLEIWSIVFLLPLLGLAGAMAILDSGPFGWQREQPRGAVSHDRWRPTEEDEYAARNELRRILLQWRTKPPGKSLVELTPPLARLCHRWPRTDAAYRAVKILCPTESDPVESVWAAVNRPFRRAPELDQIWGL